MIMKKKIWSAGGVVYQNKHVLICYRKTTDLFCLPKGTPEKGESVFETAIREVKEETGIITEIMSKIDSISYEFIKPFGDNKYEQNIVYNKIVHYFLMNKIGGNLKNHDDEFDSIYWMTLSESKEKLTYKNEIEIVEKAFSSRNKN